MSKNGPAQMPQREELQGKDPELYNWGISENQTFINQYKTAGAEHHYKKKVYNNRHTPGWKRTNKPGF